jgi:hypothetical protein
MELFWKIDPFELMLPKVDETEMEAVVAAEAEEAVEVGNNVGVMEETEEAAAAAAVVVVNVGDMEVEEMTDDMMMV